MLVGGNEGATDRMPVHLGFSWKGDTDPSILQKLYGKTLVPVPQFLPEGAGCSLASL